MLLQDFEGDGRLPIAYASKKLLPREKNYSVIEKRPDVNAIIDSVMTSDLIRMCVFGYALYYCHNWRERFVPLYCMHLQLSTVLWRPTLYACAYSGLRYTIAIIGGKDLFPMYRMHRPCLEIRPDYVMCAQFLLWAILFFPRQTRVYMFLNEGLLILGICGQT